MNADKIAHKMPMIERIKNNRTTNETSAFGPLSVKNTMMLTNTVNKELTPNNVPNFLLSK